MGLPVEIIGEGSGSCSGEATTSLTVIATPAEGWFIYEIRAYAIWRHIERVNGTQKSSPAVFPELHGSEENPYYYTRVEIEFRQYPTYTFNIYASVRTALAREEGAVASCSPSTAEVEPNTDVPISLNATPQTDNYKFFKWVGGSSNTEIIDPYSPNTTAIVHVGQTVTQPDQYFRADYILISDVTLSVLAVRCEASPNENSGEAPLTTSVTIQNPDEHCYSLYWTDLNWTNRPNPREITITQDSAYKVYAYQDWIISTDVTDDRTYGTVTAEPYPSGRYPMPIQDGGVVDKGISYWQNNLQSGSYSTNRVRITITDNPMNPPGTFYVSCDIYYGTYDTQSGELTLEQVVSTTNRYYQIDVNRYYNDDNPQNRYKFRFRGVVFHYSQLSGGDILYGDVGDLIYGDDGDLLYGFGAYAS